MGWGGPDPGCVRQRVVGKGGSRDGAQVCVWHMLVARGCSEACLTPALTCCALPAEDIRPRPAAGPSSHGQQSGRSLPALPFVCCQWPCSVLRRPPGRAGLPLHLRPPPCPCRHHHPTHPASSTPHAARGPPSGEDVPTCFIQEQHPAVLLFQGKDSLGVFNRFLHPQDS